MFASQDANSDKEQDKQAASMRQIRIEVRFGATFPTAGAGCCEHA